MIDKRQSARVPLEVDVTCQISGAGSVSGRSRDLSVGGMFIDCRDKVPFGAEVTIGCVLPSLGEVSLAGTVRWSTDSGFGVQFGLLGARETHALAQYVSGANSRR